MPVISQISCELCHMRPIRTLLKQFDTEMFKLIDTSICRYMNLPSNLVFTDEENTLLIRDEPYVSMVGV